MIIAKRGYTVEVTSWENDGDNYRTKSVTYDNKELAIAIAKLFNTVYLSRNNYKGAKGIGNSTERCDKTDAIILDFMKDYPVLYDNKELDDEEIIDCCMEYSDALLGGSEYYYARVCEKVSVYYLAEDVKAEFISF